VKHIQSIYIYKVRRLLILGGGKHPFILIHFYSKH